MRVIRTSKAAKISIMLATLVLLVLILAPWWAGRADIRLMGELFLYLALASLWNLMAGYAGLVSVGQQAYVGFGGYMLFALTIFAGFPPVVAIVFPDVNILGPTTTPLLIAFLREILTPEPVSYTHLRAHET